MPHFTPKIEYYLVVNTQSRITRQGAFLQLGCDNTFWIDSMEPTALSLDCIPGIRSGMSATEAEYPTGDAAIEQLVR